MVQKKRQARSSIRKNLLLLWFAHEHITTGKEFDLSSSLFAVVLVHEHIMMG